jgi:phytoene dehydrogenase-like protein
MNEYDYTIIGAGIAGLYCALLLSLKYPDRKVLILEKNNYLGGRVLVEKFCGKDVVIGAGVGRYGKDRNLQALLERYNLHVKPYLSKKSTIGFEHVDVYKMTNDMLKKKLDLTKTFKENFIHIYGKDLWKRFVLSSGYTDFEDADVLDTLKYYGWDDYKEGVQYFSVPWEELKEKMVEELKKNGVIIHKNIDVSNVKKLGENNIVIEAHKTSGGPRKVFESKNVILATNLYG